MIMTSTAVGERLVLLTDSQIMYYGAKVAESTMKVMTLSAQLEPL
jgi:hypothetical protein